MTGEPRQSIATVQAGPRTARNADAAAPHRVAIPAARAGSASEQRLIAGHSNLRHEATREPARYPYGALPGNQARRLRQRPRISGRPVLLVDLLSRPLRPEQPA
jgi:hypothetical protein